MIKAIIFDCYGVLILTGYEYYRDHFFYDKLDKQQAADDLYKQCLYGFISYYDFGKELAAMAQMPPAEVHSYLDGQPENTKLLDYIRFKLKPRFSLAMLSNASRPQIEQLFTLERLSMFDVIALSGDTKLVKPSPAAFINVADQLGVRPEECLFIDDRLPNVGAARAVGMQALHYAPYSNAERMAPQIEALIAASIQPAPPATDSDHLK